MIDLNNLDRKLSELERRLDEALSKETKETLTDFVSMKRKKVKINKGKRTKQTGIEYLRDIYKHDYRCPVKFDTAEKMQLEIMDEFSEWLAKEEYVLGHLSSTWRKRVNDPPISMSVLYQMFLDNKKTK